MPGVVHVALRVRRNRVQASVRITQAGRLDLDHVRPELPEDRRRPRPGDEAGHVDDLQPGEDVLFAHDITAVGPQGKACAPDARLAFGSSLGTAGAPAFAMRELVCSTDIKAPAQIVWDVLTDLARFREWNPFIREARGDLRVGGCVHVRVRSSHAVPMRFHAWVLVSQEPHELRWRGHILTPWIGDGEHTFTIEPLASGGVRFVQREVFRGLLSRIARRFLEHETRRCFDAMNRALKARAESAAAAQLGRATRGRAVGLP